MAAQSRKELRIGFFDVTGMFDDSVSGSVCAYFKEFVDERCPELDCSVVVSKVPQTVCFEPQESGALILYIARALIEGNKKFNFEKLNMNILRLGMVDEIRRRTLKQIKGLYS